MKNKLEKSWVSLMENKAYKLLRVSKNHQGKIYPLFVNANHEIEMNKWIEAEYGEINDKGKVKSKLGALCFRPGWHLSDIPYAPHIGKKGKKGQIEFMNENYIWCECEYSNDIDYQEQANENGMNKKGVIIPKLAYLKDIPYDGFYRYKTNPNMYGDWIIAGAIKVDRILSDQEVNNILIGNVIEPMTRFGGEINLNEYGLV